MSVQGEVVSQEIFTQVLVAAKSRRGRLSGRKSMKPLPLFKPKVLCGDCRSMIGAFVANEPHVALTSYVVDGLAQGDLEHYGCRVCSTKLVRDKESHDFGVRWRLI